MQTPKLFDYATKELSQDAIICWLIAWAQTEPADEADKMLCKLGRTFVDALLAEHGKTLSWEAVQRVECSDKPTLLQQETVIIDRKRHSMDVLACISDARARHVLLIEDKIDGDGDVGQLKRYHKILTVGRKTKSGETKTTRLGLVPEEQVRAIYLATGNHSFAKTQLIEAGTPFRVFNRNDFLKVLGTYHGDHPVVKDFEERLQRWEDETNSFLDWKRDDRRKQWPWTAWQGLYRRLESVIKIEDWGYVPLGDFLGLWWHFKNTKRAGAKWLYLQLEVAPKEPSRQKLCFKVEVDKNSSSAEKGTIRDECSKTILDMKDARVERPRRMGVGRHMTVAVWRGDWLGFDEDDLIDINTTAANLSAAEELIDDAAKRL